MEGRALANEVQRRAHKGEWRGAAALLQSRGLAPPTGDTRRALEAKLFEDQKDTIKLSTLVSNVVDRETQEKIAIVKKRLIDTHGYNEESATDVLNFVASIFARGEAKDRKN